MSARLMRKFLEEKEQQQQLLNKPDPNPQSDDNDDDSATSPVPRNPFHLLDDQDAQEETDKEVLEEMHEEKVNFAVKETTEVIPTSKSKKKNKKKKNKEESNVAKRTEESIESILEDLAISEGSSGLKFGDDSSTSVSAETQPKTTSQSTSFVLAVDPKHLKAENELRKIFGSKVVKSFENKQGGGSSRQMHGGRRGAYNPRRTILISPSNHWPRWDGSLSMELLETKGGTHYFRYVHSQSYIYVQEAFEAAKSTHDLNAIGSILAHQPYHIEALLTFAEVFKFSGEHQSSADAIGKCLFALECAWHPLFSPTQGNCQLKYNHDTNKPLFTALFSHMKNMDRRGCHRSALEVCKFLLSLDSDDPMGALFCIDYFSLRAQEFSWLEYFTGEYRSDYSLWLFPNFSYSLAISRFYLEQGSASEEVAVQTDKATSGDLMKQALMLHPLVLKKLVDKAPLKDAAWTQILKHSFFGSAKAGSPSLDHLINIYVERSYLMWRFPELQNFLKEAALVVIESLKNSNAEVNDWECIRKEAFSSPKNEYSHLLVSDFSDTVPSLPPEELRQFMGGQPMAHAMPDPGRIGNPEGAREVAGRNPAVVFLESLLPWVDYGVNRNDEQHDEDRDI